MPPRVSIIGFARSAKTNAEFREWMKPFLEVGTDEQRDEFLSFCYYQIGQYGSAEAFTDVATKLTDLENNLLAGSTVVSSLLLRLSLVLFL